MSTNNPSESWSPDPGTTTFADTFSPSSRYSYTERRYSSSDGSESVQGMRRAAVSPTEDSYDEENSVEEVAASLNNEDDYDDDDYSRSGYTGSYTSGRRSGTYSPSYTGSPYTRTGSPYTGSGSYTPSYTGSPSFVSLPTFGNTTRRTPPIPTQDPTARLSKITERTEEPSRPVSMAISNQSDTRRALNPAARPISGHSRASTDPSSDKTLPQPGRLSELRAVFEQGQTPTHSRTGSNPGYTSSSPFGTSLGYTAGTQTNSFTNSFSGTPTGYGSRPSSPTKSGGSSGSYTESRSAFTQRPTTTTGTRSVFSETDGYTQTNTPASHTQSAWTTTDSYTRTGTGAGSYSTPFTEDDTTTKTSVTPRSGSALRKPQTSPRSPLASVRNIVAQWKERTPAERKSQSPGSAASLSPPLKAGQREHDDGLRGLRRNLEGARERLIQSRAVSGGAGTSGRAITGGHHQPPPSRREKKEEQPQQQASQPARNREEEDAGDTGSVRSGQGVDLAEFGNYAQSQEPPLHMGRLWYLNVHASPPYRWQRCDALLYPHMLMLSWLAPGGGRGIVALDLLNCTSVQVAPAPTLASARDDIGTAAAAQQTDKDGRPLAEILVPFHMMYSDGVERLAAESTIERQKWINRIWEVVNKPIPADSVSVTRSPTGSIRTIASMRSSRSSGSHSTFFMPPLSTIPDISDEPLSRQSSFISSHHRGTVDDTVIRDQEYIYPGDPRAINPLTRGRSLRRSSSMADIDEEFKESSGGRGIIGNVIRLFGGGSDTASSRSSVGRSTFFTPPPSTGIRSGESSARESGEFFSMPSDGSRSNVSSTYFSGSQTSFTRSPGTTAMTGTGTFTDTQPRTNFTRSMTSATPDSGSSGYLSPYTGSLASRSRDSLSASSSSSSSSMRYSDTLSPSHYAQTLSQSAQTLSPSGNTASDTALSADLASASPSQYTETLSPSRYTGTVSPSRYTDTLSPSRYTQSVTQRSGSGTSTGGDSEYSFVETPSSLSRTREIRRRTAGSVSGVSGVSGISGVSGVSGSSAVSGRTWTSGYGSEFSHSRTPSTSSISDSEQVDGSRTPTASQGSFTPRSGSISLRSDGDSYSGSWDSRSRSESASGISGSIGWGGSGGSYSGSWTASPRTTGSGSFTGSGSWSGTRSGTGSGTGTGTGSWTASGTGASFTPDSGDITLTGDSPLASTSSRYIADHTPISSSETGYDVCRSSDLTDFSRVTYSSWTATPTSQTVTPLVAEQSQKQLEAAEEFIALDEIRSEYSTAQLASSRHSIAESWMSFPTIPGTEYLSLESRSESYRTASEPGMETEYKTASEPSLYETAAVYRSEVPDIPSEASTPTLSSLSLGFPHDSDHQSIVDLPDIIPNIPSPSAISEMLPEEIPLPSSASSSVISEPRELLVPLDAAPPPRRRPPQARIPPRRSTAPPQMHYNEPRQETYEAPREPIREVPRQATYVPVTPPSSIRQPVYEPVEETVYEAIEEDSDEYVDEPAYEPPSRMETPPPIRTPSEARTPTARSVREQERTPTRASRTPSLASASSVADPPSPVFQTRASRTPSLASAGSVAAPPSPVPQTRASRTPSLASEPSSAALASPIPQTRGSRTASLASVSSVASPRSPALTVARTQRSSASIVSRSPSAVIAQQLESPALPPLPLTEASMSPSMSASLSPLPRSVDVSDIRTPSSIHLSSSVSSIASFEPPAVPRAASLYDDDDISLLSSLPDSSFPRTSALTPTSIVMSYASTTSTLPPASSPRVLQTTVPSSRISSSVSISSSELQPSSTILSSAISSVRPHWRAMTDASYDSSILQPSPSVRSIALVEERDRDISLETSFLRPTIPDSTAGRLSTVPPSPTQASMHRTPLPSITPVSSLPVSVLSASDMGTPSSLSMTSESFSEESSSFGPTTVTRSISSVSTSSMMSTASQSSLSSSIFNPSEMGDYYEPALPVVREVSVSLESSSIISPSELTTTSSSLSSTVTPLAESSEWPSSTIEIATIPSESISESLPSSPTPLSPSSPASPTPVPSLRIPTPEGTMLISSVTDDASVVTEQLTLGETRSMSTGSFRDLGADIDRLAEDLRTYDQARGLENEELVENLQALRTELMDLAEFLRRTPSPPPVPIIVQAPPAPAPVHVQQPAPIQIIIAPRPPPPQPVAVPVAPPTPTLPPVMEEPARRGVELVDRGVGGSDIVELFPQRPRSPPVYQVSLPGTAQSVSRNTSNASSFRSFMSSHHSDEFLWEEGTSQVESHVPPVSRRLTIEETTDSSLGDTESVASTMESTVQGDTETTSSSSPAPSTVDEPQQHRELQLPPIIVQAPELPEEIADALDAIQAQIRALTAGQDQTKELLATLRDQPPMELPEDHSYELKDRLGRIEDLVKILLDHQMNPPAPVSIHSAAPSLLERHAPPPSDRTSIISESDSSNTLLRLERVLRDLTAPSIPAMPTPRAAATGPTLAQKLDEILSAPSQLPPPVIEEPPRVQPFVYHARGRGERPRSASPSGDAPPRFPTAPPAFIYQPRLQQPQVHRPVAAAAPAPSEPSQSSSSDASSGRDDFSIHNQPAPQPQPRQRGREDGLRERLERMPPVAPIFSQPRSESAPMPGAQVDVDARPIPGWYRDSQKAQVQQKPAQPASQTPPIQPPVVHTVPAPLGAPSGPSRVYMPMPAGPTVVQLPPLFDSLMEILRENRLAQLATVDQQRELMRYMRGLNEWLEQDVYNRQEEIRDVLARVDDLGRDVRNLQNRASVPSMISTDSSETDRISFPVPQVPQSFPTGFPPTFQPYPVQHQGVIPGVVPGLVPTFPVPGGPGPIVPAPPATVAQHPLATPVVPGPVRYRPSEQTPVIPRPPTAFVPSRPSTGSPRPGTEPIPIPPRGEDTMGGITVVSRSSDGSSTWTDSRRSSPSYHRDYNRHGTITSARPSSSGQSRPSRRHRDSSTHRASSRRSPSHRESSTRRPSSHRPSSLHRSDSPSPPLVVTNPGYSPSIHRTPSAYSRPYSRPTSTHSRPASAYSRPASVHSRPASAQEFHPPTVHVIAPSTTSTPGHDLSAPPPSAAPAQSQHQPTIIIQQPSAPAAAPIIIQNPAQQPAQVITMPPSGGVPSMAGSIGEQDSRYDSYPTTMYPPTMPPIPSTPTHVGHPQQLQPPTIINIPGQPGYPLSDAHGMPISNYPMPQSGYGIPGQPTYATGPGGQPFVTSAYPSGQGTTYIMEDQGSGSTRSSSGRSRSRSRSGRGRRRRRSGSRRSHSGSRRYSRERYPSTTAPTSAPGPVIIHTSNPAPAGPSRRSSSPSRHRSRSSSRRRADPSQHPIIIQQPPGSQMPMTPMPGQFGSVPGMPYTTAPTFTQPGTFMTQGPPYTVAPPATQIIMPTDTRSSRSRSRSPSRRERRRSSRSRSRERLPAPVIIQTPGTAAPLQAPPTMYPAPPTPAPAGTVPAGIPMMMMPPSTAPQQMPAVIMPARSRSSSRGRRRSPSHGRRHSSPRQTIVLPPTQPTTGGPAPHAPSQPILIHQPAVPGPPLQQVIPGQHLPPGMVMQPSIMRQPTSRRSHSRSHSPHRSERHPQQPVPPPTTIVQVPGAPITGVGHHPTGHLPSGYPPTGYPPTQGRYAMTGGHPTTYGRRSPSPRRDHGRRSRSSSPHRRRRPRSYSSSRSPSRRGHRSARSRSYDRHGRRHSRSYSPRRRSRSHSRDRHSRPHSSDYSRRRSPVSTRRHSPISTRRYSPVSTRRRSPVSTRRYSPVSTRRSGSPVRGELSPSPRWRSARTGARQTRSLTPPPTSRRHATRAASPPRIRTVGRSPPRIRVVNEPSYSTRRGASPRRQHSFRSSSETSVQRYPYRGRRQRPASPSPSFRSITPTQTRHGGTSLGPRRSRSLSPPSPRVLPPRSVRRYADQVRDGDSPVRAGEGAAYPRSAEEDDRSIRITVPSRHPGRRSPSILPLDQRSPVLHPHAPSARPMSHLSDIDPSMYGGPPSTYGGEAVVLPPRRSSSFDAESDGRRTPRTSSVAPSRRTTAALPSTTPANVSAVRKGTPPPPALPEPSRQSTATPLALEDPVRLAELESLAGRVAQTAATVEEAESQREAEFRQHEDHRDQLFEDQERLRNEEARQRADAIWGDLERRLAALPIPTAPAAAAAPAAEAEGEMADSESIRSIRSLSERAAARYAEELLETVRLEREDFARERAAMLEERQKLVDALNAEKNEVIVQKDDRIRALEDELDMLRRDIEDEKERRQRDEEEIRERDRADMAERDENLRNQLGDVTDLMQGMRDTLETRKQVEDERVEAKMTRREDKDARMIELFEMVRKIHDDVQDSKQQADEDREESRQALQRMVHDLQGQNAQLQEALAILREDIRQDCDRHHEATIAAVRSTSHEQVPFNVQGYLDEFSRALATEVRLLLADVGKIREERRALQHEIGDLLLMKSKYGPGGEYEPEWNPAGPPPAPADIPPPPPPHDPSPGAPPPSKPGWRELHPSEVKKKKKGKKGTMRGSTSAAPPPPQPPVHAPGAGYGGDFGHPTDLRAQVGQSWAPWYPVAGSGQVTPPPHEPTVMMPRREEARPMGLFGPRSSNSSMLDQ